MMKDLILVIIQNDIVNRKVGETIEDLIGTNLKRSSPGA